MSDKTAEGQGEAMENNTALKNKTGAFEKARLIHEALEILIAGNLIDERDDLNEASFIEWYDRTIPEVHDIKILAGAMEVELARRRGERILAEGERRGRPESYPEKSYQPVTFLSGAAKIQRFRDRAIASRPEIVAAYLQERAKAERPPSVSGAADAVNLAKTKKRSKSKPKVRRFEAGQTRTNQFDIEIIAVLDGLADNVQRSDAQIMHIIKTTSARKLSRFFMRVRLIPWLTIDRSPEGTVFVIDQELREICEGKRPRPELEIKSIFKFLQDLRAEIKWRRDDNNDKFKNPRWNSELIHRRKQSVLLDWIEEQLGRVQNL